TGADLSGIADRITSAAKAFYDGLTSFGNATLEFLNSLKLDEQVINDVFDKSISGPLFAVKPFFDPSGSEVVIGVNILSNIDFKNLLDFSYAYEGVFNVSGALGSRFLLGLDMQVGVAIGLRTGNTPVGDIPLPSLDDSDLFFNLNRFDVGLGLTLNGLKADIGLQDFINATIVDGGFDIKAAASIKATDPDNTDGKGRITRKDVTRLSKTADLFSFSPALAFDGRLELGGTLGSFNISDFGNPILTVKSSIIQGKLVPDYFIDVSIQADKVKSNLRSVFSKVADFGSSIDNSSFLSTTLPFIRESLGGILTSKDGRHLGDVLSFQRVTGVGSNNEQTKTNVLEDYYAKSLQDGKTPTYGGLIGHLQDYLAASGDYKNLEPLFPSNYEDVDDTPFAVGGGLILQSRNEIQELSVNATAGTYRLTMAMGGGEFKTAPIAWNADKSAIESAILETIGTMTDWLNADVTVRDSGSKYQIEFQGSMSGTNLSRLKVDTTSLNGNASISTTQQGATRGLVLDLLVNLAKDVSLPFDLGTGLDDLGFALKGDGTINLSALVGMDLSFGMEFTSFNDLGSGDNFFFQARDISAKAVATLSNFNAGVSLGVLDAKIDNGEFRFEAGAGIQVKKSNESQYGGQKVSVSDFSNSASGDLIKADAGLWAIANFPIKANLFGGDLTKLTGGQNPSVEIKWGSQAYPIDIALVSQTKPIIIRKNFTNLAGLTNMTPAMMVQMLVNIGDFLNQFRDLEAFSIPIPFTGSNLGDAFDFAYGWTKILNERLQGILSFNLMGSEIISPVLDKDIAFDLMLERPGDLVISRYTVLLKRSDTLGFKRIEELASYIGNKVAIATNGALRLNDQLPKWIESSITTGSIDTTGNQSSAVASTGLAATVTRDATGGTAIPAQLLLDISTALGVVSVSYKGRAQTSVELLSSDSDSQIASKFAAAFAQQVQSAISNIAVTGNRADGFKVAFAGALAGKAFTAEDFNVAMPIASSATSNVSTKDVATSGVSGKQVLSISGYASGKFSLRLLGKSTEAIRYIADPNVQAKMILAALEPIIGAGNVFVTFPQKDPLDPTGQKSNYGTAPNFLIRFTGSFAGKKIPKIEVINNQLKSGRGSSGIPDIRIVDLVPGVSGTGEVQLVTINANPTSPATFKLQWTHNSKTYETALLRTNSNSSEVRDALLNATRSGGTLKTDLPGVNIRVTAVEPGSWKIVFEGSLIGVDVSSLVVSSLTNATPPTIALRTSQDASLVSEVQSMIFNSPSGLFKIQLGTSENRTANLMATASAADVQKALESLTDIGSGNVKVTGENQRYRISFQGKLSGKTLPLLVVSPVQEIKFAVQKPGVGEVLKQQMELRFKGQDTYTAPIEISGFTSLELKNSIKASIEKLQGVGIGNVSVEIDPIDSSGKTWLVCIGGSYLGKTTEAIEIRSKVEITKNSLKTETVNQVVGQAVVSSLMNVIATQTRPMSDGLTWGKIKFEPVNTEDFTYIAIVPSARVLISTISDGSNATNEVQRMKLVGVSTQSSSTYQLRLTVTGDQQSGVEKTATTTNISAGADATTIQAALNSALQNAGIVGSVTVEAIEGSVMDYKLTFGGGLASKDLSSIESITEKLLAAPVPEAVSYTLQQGRAQSREVAARQEVQRINFNNIGGGKFDLSLQINGLNYGTKNSIPAKPSDSDFTKAFEQLQPSEIASMTVMQKRAKLIEIELKNALVTDDGMLQAADLQVIPVPGGTENAYAFDIIYKGSLANRDIPTIAIFGDELSAASTLGNDVTYANGSSALRFDPKGAEALTEIGPKYNTLEDFALVLQDAINELLPNGDTFSIEARFDPENQDFLFDVKLNPALPSYELPLSLQVDNLAPLASLAGKGTLGLNAGIDFTSTIGIDFNKPKNFDIDGGKLTYKEFIGQSSSTFSPSKLLQDPSKTFDYSTNPVVPGKLAISFDGDRYELDFPFATTDNTLEKVIDRMKDAISSKAINEAGLLKRLGYTNLSNAIHITSTVVSGIPQIQWTVYGSTIQSVDFETQPVRTTSGTRINVLDRLGIRTDSIDLSAKSIDLPLSISIPSGIAFDLIINGADDVAINGITSETIDNRITVVIPRGTYSQADFLVQFNTALNSLVDSKLGPLEGKVDKLSSVLEASIVENNSGKKVFRLSTKNELITTLELRAFDDDPIIRILGILPSAINKARGVNLFLQDTLLGGGITVGTRDFSAQASLGFVKMSLGKLEAVIDAGVNIQLLDGPGGTPGGRIYVADLVDASTRYDNLIGLRGDLKLGKGANETLTTGPSNAQGRLAKDVGLKVSLLDPSWNSGKPVDLQVALLASDTKENSSIADLVTDLNNAIQNAITSWIDKNPTSPVLSSVIALKNHVFVQVGELLSYNVNTKTTTSTPNGAVRFVAPNIAGMTVQGRRLIVDYISPITFSDSSYTSNSEPTASLLMSDMKIDAGGFSLIPPGIDPSIEIGVPLKDVWDGTKSLSEAIYVQVIGADNLLGFGKLSWTQIIVGLKMISKLLGQFESFSFLNQPLPIVDKSVNDILDIAESLAKAVDQLGTNPAKGLSELEKILSESFGVPIYDPANPDKLGVSLEYDVATNAVQILIPYEIQLLNSTYPVSIDLQSLGELIGGNTLADAMGDISSIVDLAASANVTINPKAVVRLAMGLDLSSGSMFIYDFDNGGTPSIPGDDKGTFARIELNVAGKDLAFNANFGPFGLGIAGGTADIFAQGGLYLKDEPTGTLGAGDGRHYVNSAVSIETLQVGSPVRLNWSSTPTSKLTKSGNGTTEQPWLLKPSKPSQEDTTSYRLGISVQGRSIPFYTTSFTVWTDPKALQDAISDAMYFGPSAIRGNVAVSPADPNDPTQGWKISLSGADIAGKTLSIQAYELDMTNFLQSVTTNVSDGQNTIQRVRIPSGSGGTFKLSVRIDGKNFTSVEISRSATDIELKGILSSLLQQFADTEQAVEVSYADPSLPPLIGGWNVEFRGKLRNREIALMTADTKNLTQVGSIAVIPLVVSKSPGVENTTRVSVVAGTSGTFKLSITYAGQSTPKTTIPIAYNAKSSEIENALNQAMGSGYTGIKVIDDTVNGGFKITFGGNNLLGKGVVVSADVTNLKAGAFGTMFRDLEVNVDGTTTVVLPSTVNLPREVVDLAKAANLLPSTATTSISAGDLAVHVNSLSKLLNSITNGTTVTSSSVSSTAIKNKHFDLSKDVNYAFPNLKSFFDMAALGNPLIRMIRDPSIIVDGIDYALKGIQSSLDVLAAVPLPLIGDQLAKGSQFIKDFRADVIKKIQDFVDTAVDTYGGMENALRMTLFDVFTEDTNRDGIIKPLTLDRYLLGATDGDNPFLNYLQDYNGDGFISADDIVVEFLAMGKTPTINGERLGYTLAGTKNDVKGDKKGGQIVQTGSKDPLTNAKALQFRMHLGQNLLSRDVDLSFDIGLPGLSLDVDGGIGLDLGWDLFFGFGVNTTDGLYLISKMPGNAGLDDAQYTGKSQSSNPKIVNPWDLAQANSGAQEVKELTVTFEAYLAGQDYPEPMNPTSGAIDPSKADEPFAAVLNTGDKKFTSGLIDPSISEADFGTLMSTLASNAMLTATVTSNPNGGFNVAFSSNSATLKLIKPAKATAKILFLQGTIKDAYGNSLVSPDGTLKTDYNPFGKQHGTRTFVRGQFQLDLIDPNQDGRLTFGEMSRGKFTDNFKSSFNGAAQANFNLELAIPSVKILPKFLADFHLAWALNEPSIPVGYSSTFSTSPKVWFTDLAMDLGSFFSDFLKPLVVEIKKVTDPLDPVVKGLTKPIPGISTIAGRDVSMLDLVETFGTGTINTKFIKNLVYMINLFNSIPTDADGLVIPIGKVFVLGGDLKDPQSKKNATLSGDTNSTNQALNSPVSSTPSKKLGASSGGSTNTGSAVGTKSFMSKLKDPNNAFQIPLLTNFSLVLDLLTGKPVDLVTFSPNNLDISRNLVISSVIYSPPTVRAGIRGTVDIDFALTLGFDTYGIIKFFDSDNPLDILDGFYVSDNYKNGKDLPEVVLESTLAVFAELDAIIVRAGIEGGIKLTGTLDLYDEFGPGKRDGKFRGSEIASILSCKPFNPLNLFEATLRTDLYAKVYVDLNTFLLGWKKVYDKELFKIELFELVHKPKGCSPILASDDNGDGTFVLHMGNLSDLPTNQVAGFDIRSLINKQASDREYQNTEDENEKFVIKETGIGSIEITATLGGTDYTVSYSGVKRLVGFAGKGDDFVDASGLRSIPILLVGGSGKDKLLGGVNDDILITSSGTTEIQGGEGNDLILMAGGTTTAKGGQGIDTYRFVGTWGQATLEDGNSEATGNVLDFSAQSAGLLFDTYNRVITTGTSKVTWNSASLITWIAGGTGLDSLDMSYETNKLHLQGASLVQARNILDSSLNPKAKELLKDTDAEGINDGVVSNTSTGGITEDTSLGNLAFRFTGFERVFGGVDSDIFVFEDKAAISGMILGGPKSGNTLNTAAEKANSRNTIDFSLYNSGVRVNVSGSSYNSPSEAISQGVVGSIPTASNINASASSVSITGFHNLIGSKGADTLVGDSNRNLILGLGGADTIVGIGSGDLLATDTISVEGASPIVSNGTLAAWKSLKARDWIWVSERFSALSSGFASDQFAIGGGDQDILLGSTGNDKIFIKGNNVFASGDMATVQTNGTGIGYTFSNALLDPSGGNDTIIEIDASTSNSSHQILAGNGNDQIRLGNGNNMVISDWGQMERDPSTFVWKSIESISGQSGGSDMVESGSGQNIVIAGGGNDTITIKAQSTSKNYVIGDEGRIEFYNNTSISRLHSTSSNSGDDSITLQPSLLSVILAGGGSDKVTTSAQINLILGDTGLFEFYASGALRIAATINSTETNGGTGSDQIVIRGPGSNGDGNIDLNLVMLGGGDDCLQANQATMTKRNIILGDEGRAEFDDAGNFNRLRIVSTTSSSGGADKIAIRANATGLEFDQALNVVLGGNQDDMIFADGRRNLVLGDTGQVEFYQSALLKSIRTTNSSEFLGAKGDDTVTLRSESQNDLVRIELNVTFGGAGNDRITTNVSSAVSNVVFGDEGRAEFDDTIFASMMGTLQTALTTSNASGADQITLASGPMLMQKASILAGRSIETGDFGSQSAIFANRNFILAGGGNDQILADAPLNLLVADTGRMEFLADGKLREITSLRQDYADARGLGSWGDDLAILYNSRRFIALDTQVIDSYGLTQNDTKNVVIAGDGADYIQLSSGNNSVLGDEGRMWIDRNVVPQVTEFWRNLETLNGHVGGKDLVEVEALDGYNVIFGGFQDDSIRAIRSNGSFSDTLGLTYQSTDLSQFIAFGDNGFVALDRMDRPFELRSTQMDFGGNDIILTPFAHDVLVGGFGNDILRTAGGDNVLFGDTGAMHWELHYPQVGWRYPEGPSTPVCTLTKITVTSESAAQAGDDILFSSAGQDLLMTGPGSDQAFSGPGNDALLSYQASLYLPLTPPLQFAGWGDQKVRSLLGDWLRDGRPNGDQASLWAYGNFVPLNQGGDNPLPDSNSNYLSGDSGDDIFFITPSGADSVYDLTGYDTVSFQLSSKSVTLDIDLLTKSQYLTTPGTTSGPSIRYLKSTDNPDISPFENFIGSPYSDVLLVSPLKITRTLRGGTQESLTSKPYGDELRVRTSGNTVQDNGLLLAVSGLGDLTHYEFETTEWIDGVPFIIDDGDREWHQSGGFTRIAGNNMLQQDAYYSTAATSDTSNVAGWNVSRLSPGAYQLALTWPEPNVSFQYKPNIVVKNSTGQVQAQTRFDQRTAVPQVNSFGSRWFDFGPTIDVGLDRFMAVDYTTKSMDYFLADGLKVD
ncbi:MAG: hypothetical protein ACKO6B_02490, partial [Planctomycetia bacterium]